jgi:hypothetical protein
VSIRHKQNHSDEETVQQIQETPNLQYFCGLSDFATEPPFAPSLFVDIRKRMGQGMFSMKSKWKFRPIVTGHCPFAVNKSFLLGILAAVG